jgi:hypothetical protein
MCIGNEDVKISNDLKEVLYVMLRGRFCPDNVVQVGACGLLWSRVKLLRKLATPSTDITLSASDPCL